ncbi:MAG TPA: sugar ABC transporter substrate-binding protein [Streptosporangiaceae bacterium]|jgi:multiple sugar transport system substrate-binding protein|nr:sugar ABC transporter substrate-binding protein [Streptosporangiaceae bacterium]
MRTTFLPERTLRAAAAAAAGLVLVTVLAACGSSGTTAGSGSSPAAGTSAAAVAAALQKPATLTFWAWAPQSAAIVAAFEKKYPKVKVNLVNAGTGTVEYTKLQNAIKAGSAPDVAQLEYFALPQFVLSGDLVDLSSFGLDSIRGNLSPAVWDSVNVSGKLVGLPQDTGPMVLFYNKAVYDKYKLPVPTTWAQFAADAKKLHAANPKAYITNDTGDPSFTTSMIWDAGGHPYTTSGKDVTINTNDAGTAKFAAMWNPLIHAGLLAPDSSWTSPWYQGLANGDIASLVIGSWMPVDLESGVAAGKGDWRVAMMPQYSAGQAVTSEEGGSSDAVLESSKNELAAVGFTEFMDSGPGAQISADSGDFPAENSILDSSSFLGTAPAYFGGQKINAVLSQAAKDVLPGWSWLPFQVYANSIFPDSAGQAYTKNVSFLSGLQAWDKASAAYGTQQGFSVTSG